MYQPEIAGNAGAAVRLAAALGLRLHLIEPFGFVWDPRRLDRAALDYHRHADLVRHSSFEAFLTALSGSSRRLILFTTRGTLGYTDLSYRRGDVLLVGQESAGVPEGVRNAADIAVRIPLGDGQRSLNVVTALAMGTGEALRQLGWPGTKSAPLP